MDGDNKKYYLKGFDVRKNSLYKKPKKKNINKEDVYSIKRTAPYGFYMIVKKNMSGPLPMKLKGSWLSYDGANRVLNAFEM